MSLLRPELLLWIAPWLGLIGWALWSSGRARRRLAAFAEPVALARLGGASPGPGEGRGLGLVGLGGALVILAASGPTWGGEDRRVEARGVEVVFAVDLSHSMLAPDEPPDRLQASRRELEEMVGELAGHRLGLVGFAGAPFTFCPLTLDAGAARLFLEQMAPEAVPIPGTALGDAVLHALPLFQEGEGAKVVVLLTDGEDHHSKPLEAAREAARQGVSLITLGIGSPGGELVPRLDWQGREQGTLTDSRGEPVRSRLDEETLREMASLTGGSYHRLTAGGGTVARVVREIQGMETAAFQRRLSRSRPDRYQLFLGPGLGLLLLGRWLGRGRRAP